MTLVNVPSTSEGSQLAGSTRLSKGIQPTSYAGGNAVVVQPPSAADAGHTILPAPEKLTEAAATDGDKEVVPSRKRQKKRISTLVDGIGSKKVDADAAGSEGAAGTAGDDGDDEDDDNVSNNNDDDDADDDDDALTALYAASEVVPTPSKRLSRVRRSDFRRNDAACDLLDEEYASTESLPPHRAQMHRRSRRSHGGKDGSMLSPDRKGRRSVAGQNVAANRGVVGGAAFERTEGDITPANVKGRPSRGSRRTPRGHQTRCTDERRGNNHEQKFAVGASVNIIFPSSPFPPYTLPAKNLKLHSGIILSLTSNKVDHECLNIAYV